MSSDEADAWVRLLRSEGLAARVGTLAEALERTAAVVPARVPLVESQRKDLRAWVEGGGRLVTPHEPLLQTLGYGRDRARSVNQVTVEKLGTASWKNAMDVQGLRSGGDLEETFGVARSKGLTIEALSRLGKGSILALALDPFDGGRVGHELLPWLGRQVGAATKAPRGPTRLGAEVYFDPGGLDGPPGDVAEILGDVRAVHVAGWNGDFNDPAANYDYAGLIEALHAKGVLVYAWLEPPFVSLKFWDENPQCRERTGTDRDAEVDWRKLIALEDPRCYDLAWGTFERLLTSFDWDGVNVAELYFEPDLVPADFTPFHPTALKRFKGDPALERERFLDFRTDLVVELNEAFLKSLNGLPNASTLDFQLTVIDDRLDPALSRIVGSDITRLAEVAKANGASLQVEDPFTVWNDGPLRYDRLSADIAGLMPPGQAFIDINVVDRAEGKPTPKMTGGELALATMSAGASGRIGIYSAGTVTPADVKRMAGSLAGSAQVYDSGVKAPWTVSAIAPGGTEFVRLDVDGAPWPASAGTALVPPGEHQLTWSTGKSRGPGLVRLTAEIGTATVTPDSLTFRYDARVRPLATIDRPAKGVRVDGQDTPLDVVAGSDGKVLRLPSGNHEVMITT